MNPNKAEFKMSVLNDVGVRMDDKLDDAHRRLAAHGGAKLALRSLAKGISGLAELVKKDVDNGEIPEEPLKVAEYVNKMIERASVMAASAAQHQENLEITATGAVQAYEEVVKSLKKEVDAEEDKLRRFSEAIKSGEIVIEDEVGPVSQASVGRPVGVKPGMSIAQQRREEDAKRAAEEKAAEAEEKAAPEQDNKAEEKAEETPKAEEKSPSGKGGKDEEKPKKRKRGRPRKSDKKG